MTESLHRSGGFKGGGGGAPLTGSNFFPKLHLFPCKRPIDRCVHLQLMRTGLINCLPPPSKFLDPPLLHRHYRRFGVIMTEEMGLQMFPENRYWSCRRDVQRQSVPQSSSSNRKSLIADGWKTGASDKKRWCRCRAETLTSLVSRWLMQFLSKVWQQSHTPMSDHTSKPQLTWGLDSNPVTTVKPVEIPTKSSHPVFKLQNPQSLPYAYRTARAFSLDAHLLCRPVLSLYLVCSGDASAVKEPSHFEVRKSSSQVRSPGVPDACPHISK